MTSSLFNNIQVSADHTRRQCYVSYIKIKCSSSLHFVSLPMKFVSYFQKISIHSSFHSKNLEDKSQGPFEFVIFEKIKFFSSTTAEEIILAG